MIAAIYSRKSKFTGKGESVENQIQLCKEYATRMSVTEYLIYEDEGFSGGNIERPSFKKMLNDAKMSKFNILICYRLDRISRNVADFSTTLELLQKYNISFVSIKEQFDTSTPMGRAMVYIASVFAQLERETIAERVKDNMLELAKTGRWLGGNAPLGFESKPMSYFDSENKERTMYTLSPISTEIQLIKIIYDKYFELKSIFKVSK
jgi:DNA invertase Pin-like site-specific DNA recombinase